MPRLRPVPDAPPRALGLVRVSQDREDLTSPELQRTAIEDHCARRGYQIIGWREGIDESGSRRRSKWWAKLDEAVGVVESGDADVLVVWRFSRTARQRLKWAVAIDRVEVAGGLLESATEPLDTSTASGRLARGMLAEFAAYEAETIGAAWRETHARRVRMGLPANGKARFGYVYVDRLHRPDPETGPLLASLYRRYLAGEGMRSLAWWLNAAGVATSPGYGASGGATWTSQGVRRMLDSGFGAGLLRVHGEYLPGAHEALIDADTWAAYQQARKARSTNRRRESSPYVLSGLVRCGHTLDDGTCGSSMGGGVFGRREGRWGTAAFRCVKAYSSGSHHPALIPMVTVEAEVLAWLEREAAGLNKRSAMKRFGRKITDLRKVDAEAIAREILDLDKQLTALTRQHAREIIPDAAYIAARDEIATERVQLVQRHDQAVTALRASATAGPVAANLLRHWDGLTVEERRAILRTLIARVVVRAGKPPAIDIVPVWGSDN